MSKTKPTFEVYYARLRRYFKSLDRIGKMWYFLVFFSIILVSTLFSFTIINHDFYKGLADYTQKTTVRNSLSRGTINSSEASLKGVVAVSTDIGTLAIDPTQSGSTTKLLDMLSDAVLNEFCSHRLRTECITNIASYTRNDAMVTETALTDSDLKQRISEYINGRMSTPIESVLIAE